MIGDEEPFDVLVVGAGASGLGVGVALKHAGITNFQILDRGRPAQSFMDWPSGMQLIMSNLFLVGPSVRHDDLIFCFIYKYRQRFAVVAKAIADRLGLETEEFEKTYRRWGMFLDDFECCGEQCVC